MLFSPYPFIRYFIFFSAGIIAYTFSGYFHVGLYALLVVLFLGVFISLKFQKPQIRGILMLCFLFVLGWILTFHQTNINLPKHYLHQENTTYYQAIISSNPENKPKTYKTEAEILAIKNQSGWKTSTGKVLLYFNKEEIIKPKYGDIFLIKGSPREIELPKNPEEFDYRRYQQYRGFYAHHFLWKNTFQKIAHQPKSRIFEFAYQANIYADSVFKTWITSKHEYAAAEAMVVGLRDAVDNDLLDAYSASGAIHVLSVSGMHVSILFLLVGFLFAWLKKRKNGIFWFTLVSFIILWLYAIFTGLTPTVLRATLMFSIIQVASAINRKHNMYNTLALSALVLLCVNPYWLFDVGFQLSYLAIFGIVFLNPYLSQLITPKTWIGRNLWDITWVSFAAQLFTFPLSIYYFHQFPTYFLLANPFVALFSFLVLPLGLLLLLVAPLSFLAKIVAFWLNISLYLLNESTFLIEKMPFATFKGFSISSIEVLLLYSIILLIIYFFQKSSLRHLQVAFGFFCLLTCWNMYEDWQQNHQQQLTIHFIPKKSGISILEGKRAMFIADSSLLNNPKIYGFHLKNYFDYQGINNNQLIDIQSFVNNRGMVTMNFAGNQIFWIQQKFKGSIQGKADYLLVSNNAIRKLYPALQNFKVRQIIVDDSNKKYVVESLKHQADSLHLNLVSLYDKGAVLIKPM